MIVYDFSQQASSFVRSTAVCSTTFRRDLLFPAPQPLSHHLRRHRSPSRHPARGCVSFFFCVLRDEHLAIHRPVQFASPAAAGIVCDTAATLLAATSQPNVYWLEEMVRPVAQRFGEWASASRTFSAITDLLAGYCLLHTVDASLVLSVRNTFPQCLLISFECQPTSEMLSP